LKLGIRTPEGGSVVPIHVGLIKDYTFVYVVCVMCAFRWFGKNKPENFGERKRMLNATFMDFYDVVWNDA
jgi:hypothetical protein